MSVFIVNKQSQFNGDHEVHNLTTGCRYMPQSQNRVELGEHPCCYDAVLFAHRNWPQSRINGCYYCCNECHTG